MDDRKKYVLRVKAREDREAIDEAIIDAHDDDRTRRREALVKRRAVRSEAFERR